MTMHLDTNFLIRMTVQGDSAFDRFRRWRSAGHHFSVSAMVWSEFLCGPLTAEDETAARSFIAEIIPIDEAAAALAARLFNASGRRSRTLADCIVAACAIQADAPLATANAQDFAPFATHGLRLAA